YNVGGENEWENIVNVKFSFSHFYSKNYKNILSVFLLF
ncbi:unnamed protein product, partial [marine sediment metagenome]